MSIISKENIIEIYCILTGISILAFWGISIAINQVPELEQGTKEIYFHLAAEISTATLLILSGAGTRQQKKWSKPLTKISLGMLLYAVINAAGLYADQNNTIITIIFITIIISTILIIATIFRNQEPVKQ